jgi:hypothetical protein
MKENIILFLQIITVDFFTAFGLYSLFFLFLSIFTKRTFLYKLDEEAKNFISFVGIVYFIVWFVGIFIFYTESNAEEQNSMLNRMFGKYWVGFWVQPILWFSITQFLRIKRIWKNVLLRIIFSFLLIISIEKYIIIITSFHRDYLPSSWTMNNDLGIYPSNFFLELLVKIIMFLLFVGIYYLTISRLKVLTKIKKTQN